MSSILLILRRHKLIYLFGFFFTVISSYGQQFYTEEIYSAKELKSVWFIDESKGFAVGEAGALKMTADGGNTWRWLKTTTAVLNKVIFLSSNIGIIAGDRVILRTADGGITWSTLSLAEDIVDISFINTTTGYALGGNNIYRTADGGITWSKLSSGNWSSPTSLHFVNSSIAFLTAGFGYGLWKTIDGGLTWIKVLNNTESYPATFTDVWFTDANIGYVVSQAGTISKTVDGGSTWVIQSNTGLILNSIRFANSNIGFASGVPSGGTTQGHYTIFTTTNGGSTWIKKDLQDGFGYGFNNSFSLGNIIGTNIVGVGSNDYIYKSTDNGITWKNLSGFGTINALYFIDENVGIAAGTGVFKTVDGGKTWKRIETFANKLTSQFWTVNTIRFTSSTTGYIAGGSGGTGGLIKTTDQGETWQKIDDSGTYWDLDFVDTNNGFFSWGSYYTYLGKTNNGGATLSTAPDIIGAGKIDFVSSTTGFHETGSFSVGENEGIWKTTNGGTSWTQVLNVPASSNHDFSSLKFFSSNVGFAVGNKGAIYKTSDGGNTWSLYAGTITDKRLVDIAFYNDTIGFIAAEDGTILRTNNNGGTWSLENFNIGNISYGFGRFFTFANGKGFIGSRTSVYTLSTTPNKQDQAITFVTIPDKTLGGPAFSLTATSTSSLPVTFNTDSDKININGTQVTLVKAGRASITASQTGNISFNTAASVSQSFCIKPSRPIITITNPNTETPTLTSSASSGNMWYMNGTAITGATNSTLTATAAGVYKVAVQADDCISEFSAETALIVTGDIPKSYELLFYPNPASRELEIRGVDEVTGYQIIDLAGRNVSAFLERKGDYYRINVLHLVKGLYIIKIQDRNRSYQLKFIKE